MSERDSPERAWRIGAPSSAAELEAGLALRWRVLRAPWQQPRGTERDRHDATARHCVAVGPDGTVVGTGRVHLTPDGVGRIRYMAVDPAYRGRGIGRGILAYLEEAARRRGSKRVAIDARNGAVDFYVRNGYSILGPGHRLFDAIPHTRMEKHL